MSENNYNDVMYKNIANAMSPKRSVHHMSELVFDVDFTEGRNTPSESHGDISIRDKLNRINNDFTG